MWLGYMGVLNLVPLEYHQKNNFFMSNRWIINAFIISKIEGTLWTWLKPSAAYLKSIYGSSSYLSLVFHTHLVLILANLVILITFSFTSRDDTGVIKHLEFPAGLLLMCIFLGCDSECSGLASCKNGLEGTNLCGWL